jgi:hypothetical protein
VRASFYIQSVILGACIVFSEKSVRNVLTILSNTALISVRSTECKEVGDALSTLILTNLAYCAITIYEGFFRKDPSDQLSFYE